MDRSLFFFGGSMSCPNRAEAKEALGSGTRGLPGCRAHASGPGRPPPPRTRHVRASHGRGPSPTTPRPPPARPGPPHRLDTRGLRVLIGRRRNPAPFPEGVVRECCGCQRRCAHGGSGVDKSGKRGPLGPRDPLCGATLPPAFLRVHACMSPFLSFFPQRFAAMTLKNQLACSLSLINIVFVRCWRFLKQILKNREDKCLWGGSWQTAGLSPMVCRK